MSGREATFSGQNDVILGALDELEETLLRYVRAEIFRTRRATSLSPPPDKHINTVSPSADRSKWRAGVPLALGAGDIDQIGFGKPRRKLEHRLGDRRCRRAGASGRGAIRRENVTPFFAVSVYRRPITSP